MHISTTTQAIPGSQARAGTKRLNRGDATGAAFERLKLLLLYVYIPYVYICYI